MSAVPEKTASGQWNCSVAHWPEVRQHLGICNVVDECYGGEDEDNCSHVYEGCGRGSVLIGGGCYELVVRDVLITWYEAADECIRREAFLASLNTFNELEDVFKGLAQLISGLIYVGLRGNVATFPELYEKCLQWADGSFAFYYNLRDEHFYLEEADETCTHVLAEKWMFELLELEVIKCKQSTTNTFLCEKQPTQKSIDTLDFMEPVRFNRVDWSGNASFLICPLGHATFAFLACDPQSKCFASETECDAPVTPLPPQFVCDNGLQHVPYTLVCDHRVDCSDDSDENFCLFNPCHHGALRCDNHQCVQASKRCDGTVHCVDGSDEVKCSVPEHIAYDEIYSTQPPAVINFDGFGSFGAEYIRSNEVQNHSFDRSLCPETHFLCAGKNAYCMPVFVRCNGVFDCPGQEDESGCDSYVCPGLYGCRASAVCVHPSHMCDGLFHCPQHDDELLCNVACPRDCVCHGLALFCSYLFPVKEFPELRFLDGHGSKITLGHLKSNSMLVLINLADCDLKRIDHVTFPNLRILDIRRNQLRSIGAEEMRNVKKLRKLALAGNPMISLFTATHDRNLRFRFLKNIDLSGVSLSTLNVTTLSIFPNLEFLNFSGCGIEHVVGGGFQSLKRIKYIDLKGNPIEIFAGDVFKDSRTLTEVWADNYRLCCPVILPSGFPLTKCHSPSDEISSCDALLRSNFYRVCLSVFSAFALLGNLYSFVYRVLVKCSANKSGFGIFVTHLCVSDFLMGVYLAVIGVADRIYLGTYLWNDTAWKQSAACSVAGCLSLLSSEVSALIIYLITLDRFLVLRFPFSRLHFTQLSAHAACGAAWLTGVILAGIPLLPVTSHWHFYNQTGICIPLPITRNDFPGHGYSFSVSIIVNFVLFLLIAAGQAFIYWSVRTNSMSADDNSTKISNSLKIARRLITIAMSDFLCWFPIGLLGLLASNGFPVPGEFNVLAGILLLPVNSAINPFLYTLNVVLEARRLAQEKRIQKMMMHTAAARNGYRNGKERLEEVRCAR